MQSTRELELQSIIRAQESRIHSLKQELASLSSLSNDPTRTLTALAQQHEQATSLLTEQANAARTRYQLELTHLRQANAHLEQSLQLEKSIREEMEAAQAKKQEEMKSKTREMERELETRIIRCEAAERERKMLSEEVMRVGKFYASATQRQPQRQETLLWVDKLIEFMGAASKALGEESQQREQTASAIGQWLREEMRKLQEEQDRSHHSQLQNREQFVQAMKELVTHAQLDYQQALASNLQFWEGLGKTKNKEEREQLAKLQAQLAADAHSHQKEVSQLQNKLDECERERRAMVVGLQEMRGLHEARERENRQEKEQLRTVVSGLLEAQEAREREFEEELNRLGEQITQLTSRYQAKLEAPLLDHYAQLRQEVQQVSQQLQSLATSPLLHSQLHHFQTAIQHHLQALNLHAPQRHSLAQIAADWSQAPAQLALSLTPEAEKDDRTAYELAVTKKHLQKLKEYCDQLESKTKKETKEVKGKEEQRGRNNELGKKVIELAAENEVLRERCEGLEKGEGRKALESGLLRMREGFLEDIVQQGRQIMLFCEKEGEYIDQMSQCVTALNSLIIDPSAALARLTARLERLPPHLTPSPLLVHPQPSHMAQRLSQLRELLQKKQSNNQSLVKSNNQLSATIREWLSKPQGSKTYRKQYEQQQESQHGKAQKFMEKRIKEVQTLRIRNREEMLARLKILQEKVTKMDAKTSHRHPSWAKLEQTFTKRLQELLSSSAGRERMRQLSGISEQALSDACSKLKAVLLQNEGMTREMELLRSAQSLSHR